MTTTDELREWAAEIDSKYRNFPPASFERRLACEVRDAADEIERLDREYVATSDDLMTAQATIARLTAQAEALAEALDVFARYLDDPDDADMPDTVVLIWVDADDDCLAPNPATPNATPADVRAARAALVAYRQEGM